MGYADIQKRRKKKLYQIQKNKRSKQNYLPKHDSFENKLKNRIFIQTIVSFILFMSIFSVFQMDSSYTVPVQQYVKEALTRQYNFNGLYHWYKEQFEGYPAILPTFAIKEKGESKAAFISPITIPPNEVKKNDFGIYLVNNSPQPVNAVERGLVIFAGKNELYGETVVIRHPRGIDSTYGMLKNVAVKKEQWVEQGESIGSADKSLFFSLKNNGNYLNPLEVISFD